MASRPTRLPGRHRPTADRSPGELFYDGNSQGGIIGGALTAFAPGLDRGVLGVPAMNYSTLLQRSVDFDTVRDRPRPRLPGRARPRRSVLALLQMLWDRAEANGYAQHMTDATRTAHARRTRC